MENYSPIKIYFFSFLRNIVALPRKIYQHLHFKGPITVNISGKNKSFKMNHFGYQLENGVFWRGLPKGWEPPSSDIWIESCKISNVILDVGANTGLYALMAKTLNPNAKVYAFEPVKRVFEKMESNFRMNDFQINNFCLALSNRDGKAIVYDSNTEHTYSVTVDKNLNASDVQVFEQEIEIARLDTLWQEQGSKIDLIKLDVESHESEVLEGMGEILRDSKPDILIEIISEDVARKVENILVPLGYKFFQLQTGMPPKLVARFPVNEEGNSFACSEERAKKLGL